MARALRCDGPSGSRGADSSPQSQREALGISEERIRVVGKHYTVIEDDVIDDERLSSMALLVYIALRRHMNANGTCWPRHSRLAKMARCSTRTVQTALLELREYGYITIDSGAKAGTSNTYILGQGTQQVPRGSEPTADQGRNQVPTEVSSERSNLREEHAVAIAPAREKKRDPLWKSIADYIVERGGSWASGAKEAVSLDRLIAWAKKEQPARWNEYLQAVLDGAWELIQGKALLPAKDKEWWTRQPYTPSSILGLAPRIVAVLKTARGPIDAAAYAEAALDAARARRKAGVA